MPQVECENRSSSFLRILIVEDNSERIECFRSWLPEDVRWVVATGAGRAIGIIQRDRRSVYAGIMLDHDLVEQIVADGEQNFSGTHVSNAIIEHISTDVPILIHSMNFAAAKTMVSKLEQAGFWVTRIPMSALTQEKLEAWLEEVRDIWRIMQG
jgi:CheY-like chemotaxis protein